MAENDQKLTLGYWSVGGACTPIRMLLHYLKVDYNNVTFSSYPEWIGKKTEYYQNPNTNLPNLPHLIDGDYFLTEAAAIPYYICSKYNRLDLFGETPQEQGRVRQMEACIMDLYKYIGMAMWGPRDKAKDTINGNLEEGKPAALLLNEIFKVIGDKQFITGKFSFADLKVAHFLTYYREIALNFDAKDPIGGNENVFRYMKGIRAMEEFKDFNGGERDPPLINDMMLKGFTPHPLP